MTIATTSNKAQWQGNGATTVFPFNFEIGNIGEATLQYMDATGGISTIASSSFSISGLGSPNGGTITYPLSGAPIAAGTSLTLLRTVPLQQLTDLVNQSNFFPDAVEGALDYEMMAIQQLAGELAVAIQAPQADAALNLTLPSAAARAGDVLAFDSLGNVTTVPIPSSVGAGQMTIEGPFVANVDFTPNVTTTLTLSQAYGTPANVAVDFDGLKQHDFTLSNKQIIFTSPIPAGINKVYIVGGTTLSVSVPPQQSVGDAQIAWVGMLFRSVDSIASLLTLSGSTHNRAYVVGYRGIGTSGGGAFYADPNDTTSAANGGTIIVGNDGTRWKRSPLGYATLSMFGAYGDGVTDDSSAIQACVDAMKGQTVIADAGKTFLMAGILLSGSSYNGTKITGDGWLKLKPDAGASTFGGAWTGIVLQQCDSVTLEAKFNGNRANMTAREQIFCVGLAGATDTRIPFLRTDEIRGDGLYVGQSNWQASSTNTFGVEIGLLMGTNTADDGRNLLSIISGAAIHAKRVVSNQIGGVINGVTEPGGVDIEPDFGYETCYDIRIDSLDVVTAGTSGLAVLGKSASGNDANLDWNCSQITIGEARILRTGTSGSALAGSGFTRCADVKIIKGFYQFNSTPGAGPVHDYSQRVEADWTVNNVTYGAWLAPSGTIYDFDFKITASGYTQCAVQATSLSAGRIRGRGFSSVAGTTYGIHTTNNGRSITQVNVAYEMDLPYDNVMSQAFYNDTSNPVTFGAGCIARNCDWSGYASYAATCNALIALQDVIGMTWAASVPTTGTWHWQTFVRNSQPANTGAKTTIGWARLNSGSNNVVGNDWAPCVCTNS